jgi:hypothetical protein
MNEFVNPQHRGVDLPKGFKDLMDVLASKGSSSDSELPAPRSETCASGLSHVSIFLNLLQSSEFEDAILGIMLKTRHSFVILRSDELLLAYTSFGAGDLVLERALREAFAEAGIIPNSDPCGAEKEMSVYCFPVSIGNPHLSEIVTKALRAYGISDADKLSFYLRA